MLVFVHGVMMVDNDASNETRFTIIKACFRIYTMRNLFLYILIFVMLIIVFAEILIIIKHLAKDTLSAYFKGGLERNLTEGLMTVLINICDILNNLNGKSFDIETRY